MSSYLSAVFRKERTWNNFRPDVMKSGLQKYIRRGMTEKALYCAGELDLMKETPTEASGSRAEGIRTNFLHRLMVIYIEDIGLGSLGLWPALDRRLDLLWKERKKPAGERNKANEETAISNMVKAMCAVPKSRSCSHVRAATFVGDAVTNQLLEGEKAQFPQVTALHKQWFADFSETCDFTGLCEGFRTALKKRCFTAFIWADRISAANEEVKDYRKKRPSWRVFKILEEELPVEYKIFHGLAMKWFAELDPLKEAKLCWMLLVLACIQRPSVDPVATCEEGGNWDINRTGTVLEVDAFVEDRHTAKGRGKSLTEFALVGAHVENESPLVIQEFKQFYEAIKKAMDTAPPAKKPTAVATKNAEKVVKTEVATDVPKETEAYEFLVRTQINTSTTKCDVYFATDNTTGDFVVVKGPFANETPIRNMLEVQEWKKAHDVPFMEAKLVYLVPDRWISGVPLGLRNKLTRTGFAPFLISKSLIAKEAVKTKVHSSKVWPPTEVVDWSQVPLHFDIAKATDAQMNDYVQGLLVRSMFGIGDLADRNFLVIGDRVISIDEEGRGKKISFQAELRKQKCEKVMKWVQAHFDKIPEGVLQEMTKEDCVALFQ